MVDERNISGSPGEKEADKIQEGDAPRASRRVPRAHLTWILAICSLVVLASALFLWHEGSQAIELDAGATVSDYQNKTRAEIQEELNKTAREGRMIVTVSSRMALHANGKLDIGVINDEANHAAQRFSLIQDDKVIYESGAIEPGKTLESCRVEGCTVGDAVIEIQAINLKTLEAQGNPTRVDVSIVEAAS